MKILHLSGQKTWRGGEQQVAYLVNHLAEMDCESLVFCPEEAVLISKINPTAKVITFARKALFQLSAARKLAQVCKQEKPAIVHLHDADAHLIGVLSASLFANKSNMVLSRRVDFAIRKKWTTRSKYQHKAIKAIVCVSEAIANIIKENFPNKQVWVVHSGILPDRFQQGFHILRDTYKIPKESLLIGNVAALADHKDHFTFLKTAQILLQKNNQLYFFLIGADQGMGEALKQWIGEQQLQERIILTGFRTDIDKILPELAIFLFTSKQEGLGTSILDAFAAQVPVVATKGGGIPELIEDGETGFLCEVGAVKDLAKKVNQLIQDRQLYTKIKENAFQRLNQSFTAKVTAQKTKAIYEQISSIKTL